jgi:glycosyltransferase involved in cell wall biosynthesis
MKKNSIYIDAVPILTTALSGVGHATLRIIRGLSEDPEIQSRYRVCLLVPINKVGLLAQWQLTNVTIKKVPLPARVWNVWPRIPFAPPIDVLFGKGIYLYPNFKHWPVLFSKSITYIHDIAFASYPEFIEPRNLTLLQNNAARWIRQSTAVVTVSETSKKEIIQHFHTPKDKVFVVHNGIDTQLFRKTSLDAVVAAKKRYKITTKKYLFFLSNLEPRKNVGRLIDAFTHLPAARKQEYSLVLVGGMSWLNDDIFTKIKAANSAGWQVIKPDKYVPDEDLPALLTGAELLVHPTIHEGFGITPLEAMACETPVIVSDIPVMHEIIGENAWYVDPCQTTDITTTIERLLGDTQARRQLSQEGPRRASEFTWENAIQQLLHCIKEVDKI